MVAPRSLPLNFWPVLNYNSAMSLLRYITTVIACLLIALPSWVFATCCCDTNCCCKSNGASTCCQSSACCCGSSQSSGCSCCKSTTGNQCDPDCKCSDSEPKKAIRAAAYEVDQSDSTFSLLPQHFTPSLFTTGKEFLTFACRPISHNRRQALLCVWLK